MDRPLQDVLKVHCFGCGALNAHGLQIKSRWQPEPFHIGYPGYAYGGTIASVVDCHCIWTALAHYCRDTGHQLEDGPLRMPLSLDPEDQLPQTDPRCWRDGAALSNARKGRTQDDHRLSGAAWRY